MARPTLYKARIVCENGVEIEAYGTTTDDAIACLRRAFKRANRRLREHYRKSGCAFSDATWEQTSDSLVIVGIRAGTVLIEGHAE